MSDSSAIGQLIQLATLQLLLEINQKMTNQNSSTNSLEKTPMNPPVETRKDEDINHPGSFQPHQDGKTSPVTEIPLQKHSSISGSGFHNSEVDDTDGIRTPHSVVDALYSDGAPSETSSFYDGTDEDDDKGDPWGVLSHSPPRNPRDVKEKYQKVSLPGHPHNKMHTTGIVRICIVGGRASGKSSLAKYFLGEKAGTFYPHQSGIFQLYTYSLNYTIKIEDKLLPRQVFIHIYDAQTGQSVVPINDSTVVYLSANGRVDPSHDDTVSKYRTQLVHSMIDRPHNATRPDAKWFCISTEANRGVNALIHKIVGERLGLPPKTRFGDVVPYGMNIPPAKKEVKTLPKESPWAKDEKLDDKERHRTSRKGMKSEMPEWKVNSGKDTRGVNKKK